MRIINISSKKNLKRKILFIYTNSIITSLLNCIIKVLIEVILKSFIDYVIFYENNCYIILTKSKTFLKSLKI